METKRLQLRTLAIGDEAITYRHIDDELLQHWIGWEKPGNIAEEAERIRKAVESIYIGPGMHFLAFEESSGEFIGMCGMEPDLEYPEEREIAVWVKKSSQGKGYGKEMLLDFISWARQGTTLQYLVYSVTSGNVGSQSLA